MQSTSLRFAPVHIVVVSFWIKGSIQYMVHFQLEMLMYHGIGDGLSGVGVLFDDLRKVCF